MFQVAPERHCIPAEGGGEGDGEAEGEGRIGVPAGGAPLALACVS